MKGIRATTDIQKDEIITRLSKLWRENPKLRLGQLIGNVYRANESLYYIEDFSLIEGLERFYEDEEEKKTEEFF